MKRHDKIRLKDGYIAKVIWYDEEKDEAGVSYLEPPDARGSHDIIYGKDVESVVGKLIPKLSPTLDFRGVSDEELRTRITALRKARLPKEGRARRGMRKKRETKPEIDNDVLLAAIEKAENEKEQKGSTTNNGG